MTVWGDYIPTSSATTEG